MPSSLVCSWLVGTTVNSSRQGQTEKSQRAAQESSPLVGNGPITERDDWCRGIMYRCKRCLFTIKDWTLKLLFFSLYNLIPYWLWTSPRNLDSTDNDAYTHWLLNATRTLTATTRMRNAMVGIVQIMDAALLPDSDLQLCNCWLYWTCSEQKRLLVSNSTHSGITVCSLSRKQKIDGVVDFKYTFQCPVQPDL